MLIPQIFWLLPPFLPWCLAFGGVLVPKINLILSLLCRDYLADQAAKDPTFKFMPVIFGDANPQCRVPEVQSQVAKFQLYSSLISGIFSALVAPHLGAASDRYGRKKVMAYASLGSFALETITIIVGTNPDTISPYWLLLGYFFDGLCGSFTSAMTLSYSYASDCTPPERRNVSFAYFHGTLFTGMAIGPVLAGYIIEWAGDIMVIFYVALACHISFIFFLILFIPESLSKERQQVARKRYHDKINSADGSFWRTNFEYYNVFSHLSVLWPKEEGSSFALRKNLVLHAAIDTCMFGVAMGAMQVLVLYAEYVFNWDNLASAKFVSIVNSVRVCGLLVLLPLVTRIVRGPVGRGGSGGNRHRGADMLDISLIRLAILFDLLGYIGYSLAKSGYVMVIAGVVASLAGIGSPSLQSSLTKHIPPDRTGQLLGATGLLHALARVVAPTIFNSIYSATVGKFPQTVFVCLGSVFVIAELLSWFLKPHGASIKVHSPFFTFLNS